MRWSSLLSVWCLFAMIPSASAQTAPAVLPVSSVEPSIPRINSLKVRLPYRVDNAGSAGVSAVELWVTRDGTNWERNQRFDGRSQPITYTAVKDGRYGFTLVIYNTAGTPGQAAPKAGDTAQQWVEIDTTPPKAALYQPKVLDGTEAGKIAFDWQVTDSNLADNPITLTCAVRPDGPWLPIVDRGANTGRYVWTLPANMPARAYLRLQAVDRAGNVATAQTPEPVSFDFSEPRGVILGIERADPRP